MLKVNFYLELFYLVRSTTLITHILLGFKTNKNHGICLRNNTKQNK